MAEEELTALCLLVVLALLILLTLHLLPTRPLARNLEVTPPCALLCTCPETLERFPGGEEHLRVLVDEAVEVAEERVCWAQEVELIVASFTRGQSREERPTAPCGKECGELDDIPGRKKETGEQMPF